MKQIQRILLHCHCERSRLSRRAWQSHFVTARLLRRFTPRNDSLLIAFVLVSIALCILFGTTLIEPMIVYGQPTKQISIPRESGRDPFVLPQGVHLLSKEIVTSGTQEVSSKDIAPPSLKINAILISDRIRLASIDRHIVTVGDSIHDEKVLEIKNDRVILGKGDKKRTLLLSQSPVQLTIEGK